MQAIKQTIWVEANRQVCIKVPVSFGEQVEVTIIPLPGLKKHSNFLECVGEDGVTYQLNDWTDEAFNLESGRCVIKDDDTTSEDIFDV